MASGHVTKYRPNPLCPVLARRSPHHRFLHLLARELSFMTRHSRLVFWVAETPRRLVEPFRDQRDGCSAIEQRQKLCRAKS
jgi:hypothetical protein